MLETMIDPRVKKLIVKFEGMYLKQYRCPAGVATIGVGRTRPTPLPATSTKEAEMAYLSQELCHTKLRLNKLPITQSQKQVMTSFVFNLGLANFLSSTLYRKMKRGAPHGQIHEQLIRWKYGGGRILRGLLLRRKAESQLLEEMSNEKFRKT